MSSWKTKRRALAAFVTFFAYKIDGFSLSNARAGIQALSRILIRAVLWESARGLEAEEKVEI
jgi:hypothetical protein